MLKKILITIAIFVTSLSTAFAGSFYIAPTLTYDSLRAGHIRYQSINPGLAGGFGGWVRDWLYVAGEIFGSPKSIDINNEPKNGQSLKTKYTYGISLLPGVELDNVLMAYLRFGFIHANFESMNTSKGGNQLGLGLETKIAECWTARAEYDYTRYGSIPSQGSLRSDQFTIAAVYHFESIGS